MVWWWLAAGIAALFIVGLALSRVMDWFADNRIGNEYGIMMRERLASGNYRVVAGVFDKHETMTAVQSWEAEALEGDLDQFFEGHDRVKIDLHS